MKEILFGLMLAILFGAMTITFCVRQLKASGTIWIRPDGSVTGDKEEWKKIQRQGDIYTLNDTVRDSIVVERNDTIDTEPRRDLDSRSPNTAT